MYVCASACTNAFELCYPTNEYFAPCKSTGKKIWCKNDIILEFPKVQEGHDAGSFITQKYY